MAAGIENRVYFAARDAKGQPLEIRGEIVDGKGASVARVETARGGLGVFSIVPDAAETLPAEDHQPGGHQRFAAAAAGICGAEDRDRDGAGRLCPRRPAGVQCPRGEGSSSAGRSRPACAACSWVSGCSSLRRPIKQAKADAVSIPLDDQVAGVVRLTVYDYTQSPPKVLAQRLVYRQPRRLVVRAAEEKKPGGEISLSIQNEKGRPVAAALGLTVLARRERTRPRRRSRLRARSAARIVAGRRPGESGRVGGHRFESFRRRRRDGDGRTAHGLPAILDLVLGCQGPLAAGKPGDAKRRRRRKKPCRPPALR